MEGRKSSLALLKSLSENWEKRAQVKKTELHYCNGFDVDLPDFNENFLPFFQCSQYQCLSAEIKSKILSAAWVLYNEKTIALETSVVNPLCIDILSGKLVGLHDEINKQAVSGIMADESYHVLMVVNSTRVTKEKRKMSFDLSLPNFVFRMQKEQSKYNEYWQKAIIQFVTVIVAEIFTSPVMSALSKDESIQPLHRETTLAHLKDELAHGKLFSYITEQFYASLSKKEKDFFIKYLPQPMLWLADVESSNWKRVLNYIGVEEIDEIMQHSFSIYKKKCSNMDYSHLALLAEEIGIKKSHLENYLS